MNPALVTVLVVIAVALLVVQHVAFERNLRRARANGTGIYRFSPPVRRLILVALLVLLPVVDVLTWH